MLPPEILSALKAYVQSRESLPAGVADAPPGGENASFNLGQTVQGSVLAETSAGVFTVRVAQQLVQLNLPDTIRTGDVVQLQVLSLQPRLTFGLSTSENPASTSQQLSDAARLLSNLITEMPTKALIQGTDQTALVSSANVLLEPTQLATQLRRAIQESGLFYESHQVEWVAGARTTAQLMVEPQNRNAAAPGQELPGAAGPAGNAAQATSWSSPVPPHLQPLVQQQLQALETGHLLWQGQMFPGQHLSWELWQEPGQHHPAEEPGEGGWVTSLHLELPRLGAVSARLRWAASGIQLSLQAASEETRNLMIRFQESLVSSMTVAGAPVASTSFSVAPHAST